MLVRPFPWFLIASLASAAGLRAGDAEIPVPPEMRLEALPVVAADPAGNPRTPAKVTLGRLLFFDPILSGPGTVACATCHHPRYGWADGRALPIGVGGSGLGPERRQVGAMMMPALTRQVPSVLNVAYNGLVAGAHQRPERAPMFWDARIEGLEAQAFAPLRSREEMRGDTCAEPEAVARAVERVRGVAEYRRLFAAAFPGAPGDPVSAEHLAAALAAFERSIVGGDSPFDRFMRGDATALSAAQQRGMAVFRKAGCIQCHGGPMFSDFKLHFIGVPDPSPEGRREFRTPTLRNLRRTAPYMHHGGLGLIEDVLVFYEQLADAVAETIDGGDAIAQPALDPLLRHLDLAPGDFAALSAFLDALNDEAYDRTEPAAVPSGLPVAGETGAPRDAP